MSAFFFFDFPPPLFPLNLNAGRKEIVISQYIYQMQFAKIFYYVLWGPYFKLNNKNVNIFKFHEPCRNFWENYISESNASNLNLQCPNGGLGVTVWEPTISNSACQNTSGFDNPKTLASWKSADIIIIISLNSPSAGKCLYLNCWDFFCIL